MLPSRVPAAVARFHALHQAGCFVMPNPWDVGSTRFLEQLGFAALATTSAGFAFSRGLPDTPTALGLADVLRHVQEIVASTSLPVNVDFQAGYASDPAGVHANVAACVGLGVAGLSIEDATGDPSAPLYALPIALERLRAARAAIDDSEVPVLLTGRCEAFLLGTPDPQRVVLERLCAYADAGADCLFAPGVRDVDAIAAIVRAVAPKPVNVVVSSAIPGLSVARLADLGVRRVSLGAGLAKVAWGAFMRAAREIAATGELDALRDAASVAELNAVFGVR